MELWRFLRFCAQQARTRRRCCRSVDPGPVGASAFVLSSCRSRNLLALYSDSFCSKWSCCERRATPRARARHVGAVALRARRAACRARRRHSCASAVHDLTTDSSRTMVSGLAQWIACWAHNVITRDTQRSLDRDQDPLFSLRENSGSPFGPLPGAFGRPSGGLREAFVRDPSGGLRSSSGPFGRSGPPYRTGRERA